MSATLTSDEVIAHLKLGPHPEGGYFRETFRDEPGHKGRAHSTAILYLLKAGEVNAGIASTLQRCGTGTLAPPLLLETRHGSVRHEHRLGPDWLRSEHPYALVPTAASGPGR